MKCACAAAYYFYIQFRGEARGGAPTPAFSGHTRSESLACDEAELGPEGLARKIAAVRAEQQQETARLREQMQAQAAAMAPHDFAAELQKRLGAMPPEQIADMRRVAMGHAEASGTTALSEAQVMARAMDKIKVGGAGSPAGPPWPSR